MGSGGLAVSGFGGVGSTLTTGGWGRCRRDAGTAGTADALVVGVGETALPAAATPATPATPAEEAREARTGSATVVGSVTDEGGTGSSLLDVTLADVCPPLPLVPRSWPFFLLA